MPVISDEELADLKNQLQNTQEEKRVAAYAHKKRVEDEKEKAEKLKIAAIILGIIAFLGIAGVAYFMFFQSSSETSEKEYAAKVSELQNEVNNLKERNQELSMQDELASNGNGNTLEDKPSIAQRKIYTVQIGAYKNKDLSLFSDNLVNFREIREGEFNKYSIGTFSTLGEAKKFRKQIVKLGLRNAFIVSYKGNKRIKIEEAW